MGNFRFSFSTVGIKQVDTIFKNVTEKANDLTEVFNKIKNDFYSFQQKVFKRQGEFQKLEKWKELSPEYEKRKSILYPGSGILVASGKLRESFKEGGEGNWTKVMPTLLEMGSILKTPDGKYNLALLHQTGTVRKGKNGNIVMPKRLPVRISSARKSKWRRFIRQHVIPAPGKPSEGGGEEE